MRGIFWLAAIVLAVFGIYHLAHSGAPSAQQVEPLLRSYLESSCKGDAEIMQLDSIRVGTYVAQFKGWPVYANHVEQCVTHDSSSYAGTTTSTYDGGHDADRNVAVAFVRRGWSGRLEMFTPELFQAAQQQMQQMMQHAFDNVKTN